MWALCFRGGYGKLCGMGRLVGTPAGSFALKGSNWFSRPQEATQSAWKQDVAPLDDIHGSLRSAIANLSPKTLPQKPAGSKVSNLALITGVAAHDLYHAGQIQLLKRLIRSD